MYRRYLAILLGLCGLLVIAGAIVAIRSEPLTGDLTRLGGYAEADFGWNGVEGKFTPPLAETGSPEASYPIVVIGDSFSLRTSADRQTPNGSFWTDFLAAETGLRVGVFDITTTSIERLVASPGYRQHPPRLVILEIAERTLKGRLAGKSDCPSPRPALLVNVHSVPEPSVPGGFQRQRALGSIEATVDELADRTRKTLLRSVFGEQATPVLRLPLTRADLFTSRRSGALLVYAEDRDKANWTDQDWRVLRCRLLHDQREVEAGGKTGFLFVLAPDKSTAYAGWLPHAPWLIDAAERIAVPPGLAMPRIDLALRDAIAAGERDVYLPDDTHWGTAGSRLVARIVLDYLRPAADATDSADLALSR